jgi:hypothetical protein
VVSSQERKPTDILQEKGQEVFTRLGFGEEITIGEWLRLGRPPICIVSNSVLRPDKFKLRNQDNLPLESPHSHSSRKKKEIFSIAGKSCQLDITGLTKSGTFTCDQRDLFTQAIFGKPSTREDYVFTTDLGKLHEAEYRIFYVPVFRNLLHLRLVWERHLIENTSQRPVSPPERTLNRLTAKWKKVQITR